jgi:predicted dehydrogenase
LVGIVDRDEARARQAGNRPAATTLFDTDLDAAIRASGPDAVIVATPPESHHDVVGRALNSDIHVLCEKPVSDDIGEVVDLVATAEERGLHLMVGMNFRYLPSSQRIRHYVESGELGALGYAQFSYLRHRDGNRADLNDYPMEMLHPLLLEQSIHHFDLLRYCYRSEVEALVADSWRPAWSTYQGDCCASVLFRMESGARVTYQGTWTGSWNKMSFCWRSDFDKGALVQRRQFDDLVRVQFRPELGLSGPRFKTADEAEPATREQLAPCTPFVDDSRVLLTELIEAVRGEADPITTARDHLGSLCLVQACIESIEAGRWVALADLHERLGIPSRLVAPDGRPGRADGSVDDR